jgi:hypothetical protein
MDWLETRLPVHILEACELPRPFGRECGGLRGDDNRSMSGLYEDIARTGVVGDCTMILHKYH